MTSVSDARHAEHALEGLGEMGVAQMQHKMVAVVPMPAVAMILPLLFSIILPCWLEMGLRSVRR